MSTSSYNLLKDALRNFENTPNQETYLAYKTLKELFNTPDPEPVPNKTFLITLEVEMTPGGQDQENMDDLGTTLASDAYNYANVADSGFVSATEV